jgi:hypothetical protein
MNNLLSPDDICTLFTSSTDKITIRQLEKGEMLIEGSPAALKFLGNLLIAQSDFSKDCGFHISPSGAGSALFTSTSNCGIYIHHKPCPHDDH